MEDNDATALRASSLLPRSAPNGPTCREQSRLVAAGRGRAPDIIQGIWRPFRFSSRCAVRGSAVLAAPPPFRLTEDDVEIVRVVARHRLIRSTHIAALVGRSLDRTNDRLLRLFHAGYIDRPRAQLDYYPTFGSAPMIYALADRGVRLLREWDGVEFRNPEWSRKNREAGRPFIEHQIEIVDFEVGVQRAVRERSDIRLISAEDMIAAAPRRLPAANPFSLQAKLSDRGIVRETAIIPDIVFGLELADGSRRNFMVEIDRGTMPVRRSDPEQTSIERKMRVYLAAHAAKQHQRQFGWANFRVLFVTTNQERIETMIDACAPIAGATAWRRSLAVLVHHVCRDQRSCRSSSLEWRDGNRRAVRLAQ